MAQAELELNTSKIANSKPRFIADLVANNLNGGYWLDGPDGEEQYIAGKFFVRIFMYTSN